MNKLLLYLRILILFLFIVPYCGVLLNYCFLALLKDKYIWQSDSIILSYLEDATYLFFIQFTYRIPILVLSFLLIELIYYCFRYSESFKNRIIASIIGGFIVGISLSMLNIALFRLNVAFQLENIIFYPLMGCFYAFLVSQTIDIKNVNNRLR